MQKPYNKSMDIHSWEYVCAASHPPLPTRLLRL